MVSIPFLVFFIINSLKHQSDFSFTVGDNLEDVIKNEDIKYSGPCVLNGNAIYECYTLQLNDEELKLYFSDGKLNSILYFGSELFFGIRNGSTFGDLKKSCATFSVDFFPYYATLVNCNGIVYHFPFNNGKVPNDEHRVYGIEFKSLKMFITNLGLSCGKPATNDE